MKRRKAERKAHDLLERVVEESKKKGQAINFKSQKTWSSAKEKAEDMSYELKI